MNSEYLFLNILILAGPLALSFDQRVHFYSYWTKLFPAIFSVMILFIVWDGLVTDRHWFFNASYTLPIRLFNLPIGEWLFFITVPYACIFTWEVLASYFSNQKFHLSLQFQTILSSVIVFTGAGLLMINKEYTGIVLIVFGSTFLLDILLKTKLLQQRRTYYFSALLFVMMFIFNGYLTARPIVLYHKEYQLDFRIITIPIEDFFYGFALVFLVLIIYEKLKGIRNE